MPNHNTISEEDFEIKLRHAIKYTGYVEGVGYAEWLPVPHISSTPDYPHDGRMFSQGSNFVSNDYALLITPVEQTLNEKDVLKSIVQINPDGSRLVNMGKSEKPEELSRLGKIDVKIDTVNQRIKITTHNVNGDIENMQTTTRSLTYTFSQFKNEYPFFNKNITFSTEQKSSINTQEVLSQAGKTAYIAGIITSEINRHMGKVSYFRPIRDGWKTVYQASSKWRYSIIPGNIASKIARFAKPVAGVGAVITFLYDAKGIDIWRNSPNDKNAVHPAKGGIDMIFIGIGFAGPAGAIVSAFYFGIDGFYPGGWAQALEDRDRREKEVQKIIPKYREVPYGPKW
ncbi:hypothetical protein [Dysgonomonas sp. GY617]|uniref:hypothetical protein n=1 Tax=Dysgonomonas sp. GY617 TaxID=2780420 RepID=UPI001883EA10|nr:hypothetical protein [Dysgonomonas sp. GY617]MBF0574794.1 hypothetical protein [Dysgonomonas sp. GY617]